MDLRTTLVEVGTKLGVSKKAVLRSVATWDALERAGLVQARGHGAGPRLTDYRLTNDGRCLADRMFRMPGGGER